MGLPLRRSQPKSEDQALQEALDIALPMLGINPSILTKPPCVPEPTVGGGRKRKQVKGLKAEETRKRARPPQPEGALDCPWRDCHAEGSAAELWEHLNVAHDQSGAYPLPHNHVDCGWDGCEFNGTSVEVVTHFKATHSSGEEVVGERKKGKENIAGPADDAEPDDDKMACRRAGCDAKIQRGRTFCRHAFGIHWHHPDYVFWCVFCGKWKRNDQNCDWRAHQAKCFSTHLEDYGRAPSTD